MAITLDGTTGITTPGLTNTGIPANVAAICNAAWTSEVIAAYQAQLEANKPVGV